MNNKIILALGGRSPFLTKTQRKLFEENEYFKESTHRVLEIENKRYFEIPVLIVEGLQTLEGGLIVRKLSEVNKYMVIKEKCLMTVNNYFIFSKDQKALKDKILKSLPKLEFVEVVLDFELKKLDVEQLDTKQVLVEIKKGENIKRESNRYLVNNTEIALLELDRFNKPSWKFPFNYGSIIGLKSEDQDYADCFIISNDKKIKVGKVFKLKTKIVDNKKLIGISVSSKLFIPLKAIMKTMDENGVDPKYLFSIEDDITKIVDEINSCYKKWKGKDYHYESTISDLKQIRSLFFKK
jgi:inorganic pyrophosphatase